MKGGVAVNDDAGLQREADMMGAMATAVSNNKGMGFANPNLNNKNIAQAVFENKTNGIVQRKTPQLSETIPPDSRENRESLAPVYKNTLFLLRNQLLRLVFKDSDEKRKSEREKFIEQINQYVSAVNEKKDIPIAEIDELIKVVNTFCELVIAETTEGGGKKIEASSLRNLEDEEKKKFATLIDIQMFGTASGFLDESPSVKGIYRPAAWHCFVSSLKRTLIQMFGMALDFMIKALL